MKRFGLIATLLLLGTVLSYFFLFGTTTTSTYDLTSGTQGDTAYEIGGVSVPLAVLIIGGLLALGLLAVGAWLTVRGRRKASLCGLVASTLLATLVGIYVCVYELSIFGMGLLLTPALLLLVPAALGFGIAWGLGHERRYLALPSAIVLNLVPITMFLYPWPLHVAFFVSAPFLEEVADEVQAGRSPKLPRWAGVFRIAAVDTKDGRVALITDANKSGRSGLVRFEPSPDGDEYGPMYNLNWDHRISERWRYQNED